MPILTVSNLTKSFGGVAVLGGVSFAMEPGEKAGLVGRNGAGKTTILRAVAGLDQPDGGSVGVRADVRVGYLAQLPDAEGGRTLWDEAASAFAELRTMERRLREAETRLSSPEVHRDEARLAEALDGYGRLRDRFETAGGFTYETEIRRTLAGLGFEEDQFAQPLDSMSGGQRSRAALARLLLSAPDLLLLDEPTNHLDLEALEWLQAFLQQYRGAVLLVSHDRYLLDAVTSRTLELDFGRLEEYPGNYGYYAAERAARRERRQEAFERQREEIEALEAYIRRYRAGQKSRQAKSREKRLERIERIEAPRTARTLSFRLEAPRRGPQVVLRAREVGKRFDEFDVLEGVSFEVRRGEKIGLIGPNGAGKTTLLRIAAGLEPPSSGAVELGPGVRIGYFAQHAEETLDLERPILEEVLGGRPFSPLQVRTLLGRFLFSGDAVYKKIGQLSGGERRRVALAKLVLDRPDLLLLDEPTIHLDLPSLESLEAALRAFPGAMLLVSHDRYLLDHVAGRLLVLEDGAATDVRGPYHAYREALAAGGRPAVVAADRDGDAGRTEARRTKVGLKRAGALRPDVAAVGPRGFEGPASRAPVRGAGGRAGVSADANHGPAPRTPPRGRAGTPDATAAGAGPGPRAARESASRRAAAPAAEDLVARISALEREQTDLSRLMGDPELYRDADRARSTVRRYEEVGAALESLYAELAGADDRNRA